MPNGRIAAKTLDSDKLAPPVVGATMTACLALVCEPTREQLRESYSVGNMLRSVQTFCKTSGKRDVAYGSLKTYALRLDSTHARRARTENDPLFTAKQRRAAHSPPKARRKYADDTRRKHDQILVASGHWERVARNVYRWHRRPLLGLAKGSIPTGKVSGSDFKISRRKSPADAKSVISTIYAAAKGCAAKDLPPPMTPQEIDEVESEWLGPLEQFRPEAGQAPSTPATDAQVLPSKRLQAGPTPQACIPSPLQAPATNGPQAAGQAHTPGRLEALRGKSMAELRAMQAAAFAAEDTAPAAPKPKPAPRAPVQLAASVAGPRTAPLPPDPGLADDSVTADSAWLRAMFSLIRCLAAANLRPLHGLGCTRGAWRAGVGGLVAMAPGAVRDPVALVMHIAREVQVGRMPDPRRRKGFFAHAGHGAQALRAANVAEHAI